jgi:hypothetical protein
MLHFFPLTDLTGQLAVAAHLADKLEGVRQQTTSKINAFMRRTLDLEVGRIEYFDTPDIVNGGAYNVWLDKKNIIPESLLISLSYGRDWDDYPLDPERIVLDPVNGKITFYGPFRRWQRSLRITYDGGYPPVMSTDNPPVPTDVMDCPYGLSFAALQQAIFDGRRSLAGDMGTSTDDDKKTPVVLVEGLLRETADAFVQYRKTLGT